MISGVFCSGFGCNMSKNVIKYNVIAFGARDYYQVALALKEAGLLFKLLTDFYCPDLLRGFFKRRFIPQISSKQTISIPLLLVLQKCARSNSLKCRIDFCFGFLSALYTFLTTNRAIVYSYYLEGFVAFYDFFKLKPLSLICFQVHPTPWFINNIINIDRELFRQYKYICFDQDIEAMYEPTRMRHYMRAIQRVDKIICASSVTAESLLTGGIDKVPCEIIPYGSKFASSSLVERNCREYGANSKIKLLTVCQLTQRKGMHWAFTAMNEIKSLDKFEWVLVSSNLDKSIADIIPSNATVISSVSESDLSLLMQESDMFVMPSLVEGFGLVYIEALSVGTPIMYTKNTGPYDFATDGVHGIEVNCSSKDDIKSFFESLAAGKIDLQSMRPNCIKLAADINWNNFKKSIVAAVESLEEKRKIPMGLNL